MKPDNPKFHISRSPGEFRIEIPANSSPGKNALLFFWLFAWTVSGMIVITYYFRLPEGNTKAAVLVWIAFWAYFEYKTMVALAWRKFGKEILEMKKGDLHIKKDFTGRGKTIKYNLEQVKNFRLNEKYGEGFFSHMNNAYWSLGEGRVVFDYFGREVTLGLQLDEKTGRKLVKALKTGIV